MIWKKKVNKAVPKNSKHWSWGDDGWQTVPNARSPTVDSRVRRITSCEENDDRRWWRLESAMHWI